MWLAYREVLPTPAAAQAASIEWLPSPSNWQMVASVPVLNLPLGGAEDSTLLANFLASFAALTAVA